MSALIRLAEPSDAEGIAAIYRPFVQTTAISFEAVPPASEEMGRRVAETLRSYPWLVCDLGGHLVGYAYATRYTVRSAYRWSVETSVYIEPSHQRRGIGRALYLSLFAILRAQGFFNAFAGIALPHPASVALHESLGFRKIGVHERTGYKFDRWHDVGWWQLVLQEHIDSPHEPADLAAMRARPEWPTLLSSGKSALLT